MRKLPEGIKMKKAQMLKFLFYLILAGIIFFPACKLASNFSKLSDKSIDSYTSLMEIIEPSNVNSVKDDEIASTPFTMNKNSVVVGFSKDDNRFENHYLQGSNDEIKSIFIKPLGCENCCEAGKACVCLCNGFKLDKNAKPYSAKCEDKLICNSIEGIDLLSEKVVKRHDNQQPKYLWKGGFLLHREISDREDANGLDENKLPIRTFYVERYKGVVDVCFESECMTDETKEKIDSP